MCAEQSSAEPAGESRKRQVPPAKVLARVAVVNPMHFIGDNECKAGRNYRASRNAKPEGSSVKAIELRETSVL